MWCAHKDKGRDGKSEDINLFKEEEKDVINVAGRECIEHGIVGEMSNESTLC